MSVDTSASERAPYHLLLDGGDGMERDPELEVVHWSGREAISAPYSYRITLAVANPDRPMEELLQERATLVADYDKDTVYFPGVVDLVRRTGRHDERLLYEIEVVPRLRAATEHQYETRIFQNQTVQQIVTDLLQEDHGFALDQDFRFDLQGRYEEFDFKVQYHESDLAFIHRLCEREGIFYFFEHRREREVICFFDHQSKYVDSTSVSYRLRPSTGTVPEEEEVLDDLTSASATVPEKIVIVDYNYRRENLSLETEELVQAARTHGVHYEYGLHFKSKSEGQRLGRVLAEGFLARSRLLQGASTIRSLRSGHKYAFRLYDLDDDPLDGEYVMTSVQHEGDQSEAVFGEQERGGGASYRNHFEAVPAERVYRPERVTPHPRVSGFLTGIVESAGGDYADIDDQGRYVVRLHYDLSGRENAKASKRVRMMQPYGGAGHGVHLPLQKGAEVAIMCMDGDPDRPVIAGALPNPSTASQVTSENRSQNVLRSVTGSEFTLDDKRGEEHVTLYSVKDLNRFVDNDVYEVVKNNQTVMVEEGDLSLYVETGARWTEIKENDELTCHKNIIVKADESITLDCGDGMAKIVLRKDGSIEIKGITVAVEGTADVGVKSAATVTTEAGALNHVKGSMVMSEAAGPNTVKGAVVLLNP